MVRWHESHDISVARCRAGRPAAAVPLWQDAQPPGVTPTCSEPRARAGAPAGPAGVAAVDAAVGAVEPAPPAPRAGRAVVVPATFAVVIRCPLLNEVVLWHCEQSAVVGG